SKITQAKSLDSRTIGENEVRRSVAAASSAMAMSRVQTTWSATGSSTMVRLGAAARTLAMITSWAAASPAAVVVFGAFQERTKLLTALARVSSKGSRWERGMAARQDERAVDSRAWYAIVQETLKRNQVRLATYVPDRVLTPLIRALHEDNDF